jgi:predicted aldo/keto reductase-like oxidoreductase
MFAAYGDELEFCQVQLNWLDWDFQKAGALVEYLNVIQKPIWVMEPLRGGSLCNLAPKYTNILQSIAPDRSLPTWGFRYLQSISGVTVVLSGMSNMAQLTENVRIFGENTPLSTEEIDVLLKIGADMTASNKIPCTQCKYCVAYCPQKLDIPGLIEIYNGYEYTPGGFIAPEQVKDLSDAQKPSACIGCGACEQVCPQKIEIRAVMDDFTARICHK